MDKRAAFARTLPSWEFAPDAGGRVRPPLPPPGADAAPSSDRVAVAEQLRRLGYQFPDGARVAVGDLLGGGATARVFAAEDRDLERPVALKVLAADGPPTAEAVAGFLAEARITASLQHPNVLPVHEVEVNARGQVFFTMKRVDGRSLGAVLE